MAADPDALHPIDGDLASRLMADHYEALKRIARVKRRRGGGQTLMTTDVLHESWLKLRGRGQDHFRDETHFMRTAALAMRNVLVDHARAKLAAKRSGGADHLPFADVADVAEALPEWAESPEQLLEIHELLRGLAAVKPRLVEVVNLRYFSGFTEAEAAELLGVTVRTIRRDWRTVRAWLAAELGRAATED
ncbi:MAG: ECF-type sigma factor [Acidobacteriota bacterium]